MVKKVKMPKPPSSRKQSEKPEAPVLSPKSDPPNPPSGLLTGEVLQLDTQLIDAGQNLSRQDDEYDEKQMDILINGIKAEGQHNPVLVRKVGSRYALVAGFRRLRAVKALGYKKIWAHLYSGTEEDAYLTNLSENLNRHNMNPMQIARAILHLRDKQKMEPKDIATKLGRPGKTSWVNRMCDLNKLSADKKKLLRDGTLSIAAAMELVNLSKADMSKVLTAAKKMPSPYKQGQATAQTVKKVKVNLGLISPAGSDKKSGGREPKAKGTGYVGLTAINKKIEEISTVKGSKKSLRAEGAIAALKWVSGQTQELKI